MYENLLFTIKFAVKLTSIAAVFIYCILSAVHVFYMLKKKKPEDDIDSFTFHIVCGIILNLLCLKFLPLSYSVVFTLIFVIHYLLKTVSNRLFKNDKIFVTVYVSITLSLYVLSYILGYCEWRI